MGWTCFQAFGVRSDPFEVRLFSLGLTGALTSTGRRLTNFTHRQEGYPCVFAGDLYGCGGDSNTEPMGQLDDFIRARKVFAYGPTRDYWDHAQCAGWVREGDAEHDGCAVVICNGTGDGEKRMQLVDSHAGEVWTDILGWSQGEITIEEDGWATFTCPAQSVAIWAKRDARGREEFNK